MIVPGRIIIAGLAAIACAACAPVGPDHRAPDIALPDTWPEDSGLDDLRFGSDPVGAEWWRMYDDTELETLVAAALPRNADIAIATARFEQAVALVQEADAAFTPQVDVNVSASRARSTRSGVPPPAPGVSTVRGTFLATFTTSFELDFWGRLRRTAEAARAEMLATAWARDYVTLTVVAAVTETWIAVQALDAQARALASTVASRDTSLDLARKRAAAGLVSDLDVYQAIVARAEAAAQAEEVARVRALAAHQLGVLTGQAGQVVPPRMRDDVLEVLPLPNVPPPGLPAMLLARRADIRAAESRVAATSALIGVARANAFPRFSLTGAFGGQSRELSEIVSSPARIWSLGANVLWPIVDAGRFRARTVGAEARHREALAAWRLTVESAFRDVADALSGLHHTTAAEVAIRERLQAARESLRLARLRYEAGYSRFLEVLDAQRTTNDAELSYLRNRQAQLAATVQLVRALGGGWSG